MRLGDFGEYPATFCARAGEAPVAERAVPGNHEAMGLAPREDAVFNSPLLQVIEHLVAGETPLPFVGDLSDLFEAATSKLLTPQERIFPSRIRSSNPATVSSSG